MTIQSDLILTGITLLVITSFVDMGTIVLYGNYLTLTPLLWHLLSALTKPMDVPPPPTGPVQ